MLKQFILFLLLSGVVIGQATVLYPDCEITTQCMNATPTQKIKYKFIPQGTVYDWISYCNYAVSNYQSSTELEVPANFISQAHGFEMRFHNEDNELRTISCIPNTCYNAALRLSEYKVEIQVYNDAIEEFETKKYFYLNMKDGSWTITLCGNGGNCSGNDITFRYDVGNNILYSKEAGVTSPIDNTWKVINQNDYWYWADIKDCENYYWFIGAPNAPSDFSVSGNTGEHPTLNWSENIEVDIDGYKIYVNYNNTNYQLLYTINNPTTTTFIDNGVTITNGKFHPIVCYKISAFDTENYESDKTSPDCVISNQLNKDSKSELGENDDYKFKLFQTYPNPFNPSTFFSYRIPADGNVNLSIYNSLGQIVSTLVNEYQTSGKYSVQFNASNLPSGVYVYKLQVGQLSSVKKMMLTK